MGKPNGLLSKILKKIKPSKNEQQKLETISKKALNVVAKHAIKYNAKAMLAGSITRHTWLPNKREFDIFILFPPSLPEDRLEEYGLKIGKDAIKELRGKFSVEYAQHPYASGLVDGIDIDIVPCYEVESAEKIKSAVDRTPFHVRYMENNLPIGLSDEVRILKQFLTANGLYGADAKVQGLSGYATELLIIKYRGFFNLMKALSNWRPGEIIDLENSHRKEDYINFSKKFKGQPLILMDPTDRNRNTASALSVENFVKFQILSKEFMKSRSEKYFSERKTKPITTGELKRHLNQRKTEIIIVEFKPPKVVPDIFWPQLRRFGERLQDILEEAKYEFKVLRRDVYSNEKNLAVILLEMEVSKLPPVQKRIGPSIFDVNDSQRFLEKYKTPLNGPFVENANWAVEIKRKFLTAHDKLSDSLKKDVKILKAKGVPNYIAEQLAKGFEIVSDGKKLNSLIKKDKNFGVFLRNYFEKERLV